MSISSNTSEIINQGWLTKSPPAKGIFKPRWRRRWFLLRAGSFPNQFVLEYFTDDSCRRKKGHINLDECEPLELSPKVPPAVQERRKFTFTLKTPNRTYYLASDSENEMNKWVRCLYQVCGLKPAEEEAFNGAVDENSQHQRAEHNMENLESDESSPTLSSSGPYIPISECFSGKPMIFNDAVNGYETGYCNTTSFPFPPKVNWATHPIKRESEATPSPRTVGPEPPPRPPKTRSPLSSAARVPKKESASSESIKTLPTPSSAPRSVFRYDNLDETQDSSSTCSSLQSPPGSAGALYTNLSDLKHSDLKGNAPGLIYKNPPGLTPNAQFSQMNPLPSPGVQVGQGSPGPKVNRSLKPDLRKICDENAKAGGGSYQHASGAMTLPTPKNNHNFSSHQISSRQQVPAIVVGPCIDRSRKPPESPITLGPTPAQVKNQSGSQGSSSKPFVSSAKYAQSTTSTLPANSRRRAGPVISPHDKNKHILFHEYEQPPDLMGTYLQIDAKLIGGGEPGEIKIHSSSKVNPRKKGPANGVAESSDVEYRMIDHDRTKALNQMRQEREQQLRNPMSKTFN